MNNPTVLIESFKNFPIPVEDRDEPWIFLGDPPMDHIAAMKTWIEGDRYLESKKLLQNGIRPDMAEEFEAYIGDKGGRFLYKMATLVIRYWTTGILPEDQTTDNDADPKDTTPPSS